MANSIHNRLARYKPESYMVIQISTMNFLVTYKTDYLLSLNVDFELVNMSFAVEQFI